MNIKISPTEALKLFKTGRRAAKELGIPKSTFMDRLRKEQAGIQAIQHIMLPRVETLNNNKQIKQYIFTCAVRGARVHTDFFENLKAYARKLGAEFHIGALTNDSGKQRHTEFNSTEFDQAIVPFLCLDPIHIDGKIAFCPELNLTPTMVKPLQGLQTYTKKLWGIFPHTKISLETVATHKDRPAKFIATTGAVTLPGYSATKAGMRAVFDHLHGAVIVEVSKNGVWFRHLTPNNELDGTFYDLDNKVEQGRVTSGHKSQALIYGDIHVEKIDPAVREATWGPNGLAGLLRPATQVLHDLMDCSAENYHSLDNMFSRFALGLTPDYDAQYGFSQAYAFLEQIKPFSTNCVVVDSNHDYFIEKWLMKFDPASKEDFVNIQTYYELKLEVLAALRKGTPFSLLEVALSKYAPKNALKGVRFLLADESLEIDKVECAWHGHRGPNGRRGSKSAFKFVTEKSTIAHLHSPAIESGSHVVGTSSLMNLGYNSGPSSWAHTHGVIYPHGGRALLTMSDNKFFAEQK